jgi:lysophospholipase L1-like esterase
MLSWRFSLRGRVLLPRRILLILVGAFLATGCGGVTTPQTLGPVLVCPANLTMQSADRNALPVFYDAPQVIAGEPPLSTKCSPQSGAIFVFGSSTVTCTTTDAVGRTGSCAFTVTVAIAPRISATSFVAFGNSITEGKTPSGALAKSYPEDLRELLAARYTTQAIVVVNAGCGGESSTGGAGPPCTGGVVRLPAILDLFHPEVVLLEEGVNDLSNGDASAIPSIIDALKAMIRDANIRGVRVFLATFPPERVGGSRAGAALVIPAANEEIRRLAAAEHVILVDLYIGFGGTPDPYIDVDGLHPTEAGYLKMAQLYFDAIRTSFELPTTAGSAMELVRNMPAQHSPFVRPR